jgi:hypothetical protein
MVEASLVNLAELGILAIGVIIALQQLRDIKQTRQTEIFMNLLARFDNPYLMGALIESRYSDWNTFEEWLEKFGPLGDREVYTRFVCLQNAIQGIGYLVSENQVKTETVSGLMSGIITLNWERNEPVIRGMREMLGSPTIWNQNEMLYNEIINYRKSRST